METLKLKNTKSQNIKDVKGSKLREKALIEINLALELLSKGIFLF